MRSRTPKSTNRGDRPGLLEGARSGVTRRGLIGAGVGAAAGAIASRPALAARRREPAAVDPRMAA